MSEFFDEYLHIVADLKPWPYFEIPDCLKMLPWSVDECYGRITPQWITKDGLTRHAVVPLALYSCDPFSDGARAGYPRPCTNAAEGYIIDQATLKNNEKKRSKYLCRDVRSLVEALATVLMHYESWCEESNWWPHFRRRLDESTQFLEDFRRLLNHLKRRDVTPKGSVARTTGDLLQSGVFYRPQIPGDLPCAIPHCLNGATLKATLLSSVSAGICATP